MAQISYAFVTTRGAQKIAAALAAETAIDLTHIAIGDGATVPSGGETALYHEVARKPISGQGVVGGALDTLYADIYLAAADGPYIIKEGGIFDSAGELIAIARIDPPINKPVPSSGQVVEGILRLQIAVSNASAVNIKVDPSLTVALQRLSLLPWIPVISITTTAPPVAPALGDTYLIPTGATGSWAAHVGKITEWTTAGWAMITPRNGHGIGLPDGRQLIRVAGVYVDLRSLLEFHLPVADFTSTVPNAPAEGAAYVIQPSAGLAGTAWQGRGNTIGRFTGGKWDFQNPRAGQIATYRSGDRLVVLHYNPLGGNQAWSEWLASETAPGPVEFSTRAEALAGASALALDPDDAWAIKRGGDRYTATGTANALAIAPTPALDAYRPGVIFWVQAIATNTGAATLNAGIGAASIRKSDGTGPGAPLTGGEIVTGETYGFASDGANFRLLTPSATETTRGLIRIATEAEVQAGTSTTTAVSPANLPKAVDKRIEARAVSSLLWPHVARLDARFDVVSPAAFAVELQQTVNFFWRGIVPFALTDYPVAMANANALKWTGLSAGTYHLVWYPPGSANAGAEAPVGTYPQGRWIMRPISDANYNPSAVTETDVFLDGNHDKVLAARVIIAGDGTATIKRYYVKGSYNLSGSFTVPVSEAGAGSGNYTGTATFGLDWAVRPYYLVTPSDVRGTYGASGANFARVHTSSATREALTVSIGNYTRLSQNPVFDYVAVR